MKENTVSHYTLIVKRHFLLYNIKNVLLVVLMQEIILRQSSPEIMLLCQRDKRLGKLISAIGDLTYTIPDDDYAFMIHEIIEQMLSVKAGRAIYGRFVDLCDGTVSPDRVSALTDDQIKGIGTSRPKVRCIREFTDYVSAGCFDKTQFLSMSDSEIIESLTRVRGIGNWTAKMYLIFVMNRKNVLPFEDRAFLQVFSWLYNTQNCQPDVVQKKCKKWRPYSSYAARYFYRALDMGMTNEEFHLYK